MKAQQIKPLTLRIDKSLWNKFKERVHRDTSLNDAIIRLISTFVYEDKYIIDMRTR